MIELSLSVTQLGIRVTSGGNWTLNYSCNLFLLVSWFLLLTLTIKRLEARFLSYELHCAFSLIWSDLLIPVSSALFKDWSITRLKKKKKPKRKTTKRNKNETKNKKQLEKKNKEKKQKKKQKETKKKRKKKEFIKQETSEKKKEKRNEK